MERQWAPGEGMKLQRTMKRLVRADRRSLAPLVGLRIVQWCPFAQCSDRSEGGLTLLSPGPNPRPGIAPLQARAQVHCSGGVR
jgi:hypothetical protein